jgi:hypothetical protein
MTGRGSLVEQAKLTAAVLIVDGGAAAGTVSQS